MLVTPYHTKANITHVPTYYISVFEKKVPDHLTILCKRLATRSTLSGISDLPIVLQRQVSNRCLILCPSKKPFKLSYIDNELSWLVDCSYLDTARRGWIS